MRGTKFTPSRRRTYGKTEDCKGCRHWSEQKGKVEGLGPVQALCLNKKSRFAYTYCRGDNYCENWESGEFGAIDGEGKDAY